MAKKILLSGAPGAGKTTVIRKIIERLPGIAGGFLTEEIRQGCQRVGFQVKNIATGEKGILAHIKGKGPERVGRYRLNLREFEQIGVQAVRDSLRKPGTIIIDEIGKMELASEKFRRILLEVFGSGHPLIATIQAKPSPFTDRLKERKDVTVLEVKPGNRDLLPETLLRQLQETFEKKV